MQSKYDVLIIGAGPAGLACAEGLKNTSLSVLVLEKQREIGPKVCAGGLTRLDATFEPPYDKTRSFSWQYIFFNAKENRIKLAYPLKTISREDLGQYQLEKIKTASNIKIVSGKKVLRIEEKQVITEDENIGFKYLVGADGSNSMVRKHLKLSFSHTMGIYYEFDILTHRFEWHVNTREWGSSYLWVFPHQKHSNIGFHFNPKIMSASKAKEILEGFLRKKGYSFADKKMFAAPLNYQYNGMDFHPIFLAGDAAGLVSKATGEGIAMAMFSGQEIARKILNPNYPFTAMQPILRIKNRHTKMIDIFDSYPRLQPLFFRVFLRLMKSRRFQKYFGN